MKFQPPEDIWIERSVTETPLVRRVLERAPGARVEIVEDGERAHERFGANPEALARGKRTLLLARQKGPFLKACPCSEGVLGCGYEILNAANNCSLDCTYCILQGLMTNPALVVYANLDDLRDELDALFRAQPERTMRVGTGEFADSLDLEPLTDYGAELVRAFGRWPGATLELKTKTDFVDTLIGLEPGRAVVAWSVNPPEIIRSEERRTASLDERLAAARRVAQAGYRVGFHFDPIIEYPGWREGYGRVVERLAEAVDPGRVAWISLGALRFPPALKPIIRRRFPTTSILDGEFVTGLDGKMRYFQPIRVELFSFLAERIRERFPGTALYLCMEPEEVWRRVFGDAPTTGDILEATLENRPMAAKRENIDCLIVCALRPEASAISSRMAGAARLRIDDHVAHRGRFAGRDAVVVQAGPGGEKARLGAQAALKAFRPRLLVNFGTAGAIAADLAAGDCLISWSAVSYSPSPAAGTLAGAAIDVHEPLRHQLEAVPGARFARFGSADFSVSDEAVRRRIAAGGDIDVVDWETHSLLSLAAQTDLPGFALRVITDLGGPKAEEEFRSSHARHLARAAEELARLLRALDFRDL